MEFAFFAAEVESDAHAFFEGLRSGRLRLVGDSRDLERLQGLLKHLR